MNLWPLVESKETTTGLYPTDHPHSMGADTRWGIESMREVNGFYYSGLTTRTRNGELHRRPQNACAADGKLAMQ